MRENPVLVKVNRGNWVENIHRGAFCVIDKNNNIIASVGNIEQEIFPHSAIKPIQALALFESGAVEKFSLSDKEIVLACSSHYGENHHIEVIEEFLRKIECSASDLECGTHIPYGKQTRDEYFLDRKIPKSVYCNSSGKHVAMLAIAKALGEKTENYLNPSYGVQRLVKSCTEMLVGYHLDDNSLEIDNCSMPTYAISLRSFALAFAKMSYGENLPSKIKKGAAIIFDTMVKYPDLLRAKEVMDSNIMRAFYGNLVIKAGNDGVIFGVLRDKNYGIAIKIDDGNMNVARVVIANLLSKLMKGNHEMQDKLLFLFGSEIIKNAARIETGKYLVVDSVFDELEGNLQDN